MKRSPLALVLMFVALGCGQSISSESQSATYFTNSKKMEVASQMEAGEQALAGVPSPTLGPPRAGAGKTRQEPTGSHETPRKIIYTAHLDLLVTDVAESAKKVDELVRQFHALVAQSEIKSDRGAPRAADWRVRVPVDRFDAFIGEVARLGEPTKNKTESDDITDNFFDFQVRIANKKVQVERLQKIIKEQTGKISDILEAERELGRVTTDLEELEGTLKLWENQTSLATVNITLLERSRYVPPETPTFAANVSRTFKGSLDGLITFLQDVALAIVAFSPWSPIVFLFAVPFWFLVRWSKARVAANAKT